MVVYIIGSLRNPEIPKIANKIQEAGHEAFADWFAAGPEADDKWRDYEKARGHNYLSALNGYAAKNVFEFDKRHIERSDAVILAAPAGKSGHLELGWAIGKGKLGYYLLDNPERWDVMLQFCTMVTDQLEDIITDLNKDRSIIYNSCSLCNSPIRFGQAFTLFKNAEAHYDCYTEYLNAKGIEQTSRKYLVRGDLRGETY